MGLCPARPGRFRGWLPDGHSFITVMGLLLSCPSPSTLPKPPNRRFTYHHPGSPRTKPPPPRSSQPRPPRPALCFCSGCSAAWTLHPHGLHPRAERTAASLATDAATHHVIRHIFC